jgi:hypothetical protein
MDLARPCAWELLLAYPDYWQAGPPDETATTEGNGAALQAVLVILSTLMKSTEMVAPSGRP